MYYAFEVRSGVEVGADDAVSGRRYYCPVCKAPVYLRDGRYRAAHFAHRPGVGSAACENYHSGWGAAPPLTGPPHQAPPLHRDTPIAPLQLAIELQPVAGQRLVRKRGWGLNLIVPASRDGRGTIKIDLAAFGYREIPLSVLALGAKSYPVDPDTATFRAVWTSHDVTPAYVDAVSERIDGLSIGKISVFAVTSGRLKPRVESLSWGATYYFVWSERSFDDLPEILGPQFFAPLGLWRCAIVTVPDHGSEPDLERWLSAATKLPIVAEKRRWGVLFPPPLGLTSDGQIEVAPGPSLQISVLPAGRDAETESAISASAATFSATATMSSDQWQFVDLQTPDILTDATVHLTWDHHQLPDIVRRRRDAPRSSEVLVEASRADGSLRRFSLHDAGATDAFRALREDGGIITLRSPKGVTGRIRWRRADPIWSDCETGVDLNALLADGSRDIEIDFGPFGYVFLAARRSIANVRTLSAELRRRAEWLCKEHGAYRTASGTVVTSAADSELVDLLRGVTPALALAGHHRVLLRTLGDTQ